jgi:hypothetical protein
VFLRRIGVTRGWRGHATTLIHSWPRRARSMYSGSDSPTSIAASSVPAESSRSSSRRPARTLLMWIVAVAATMVRMRRGSNDAFYHLAHASGEAFGKAASPAPAGG